MMERKIEQGDYSHIGVINTNDGFVGLKQLEMSVIIEKSNIAQLITILQDFLKKEDEKGNNGQNAAN